MKIFSRTSIYFALVLCTFSCKDSFVNVDNPTAISTANYPKSVSDLEQLLAGAYATQHAGGIFGRAIGPYSTYLWDHTCDLSWQGSPNWIQMAQNNALPSDNFLVQIWPDLWRGVQRCNTILEACENLNEEASASDKESIELIKGQTLFLRAWYYSYLVAFWGESFLVTAADENKMGVPIITEVANNLDNTQVERNTVKECWDFIISDLKASETILEGKLGLQKPISTKWTNGV